jgi:hypothetical protein
MIYAILDSEGKCINRTIWDGQSDWQPPEGCTAVADPDNLHPIDLPEQTPPAVEPTAEQKLEAAGLTVAGLKELFGLP